MKSNYKIQTEIKLKCSCKSFKQIIYFFHICLPLTKNIVQRLFSIAVLNVYVNERWCWKGKGERGRRPRRPGAGVHTKFFYKHEHVFLTL